MQDLHTLSWVKNGIGAIEKKNQVHYMTFGRQRKAKEIKRDGKINLPSPFRKRNEYHTLSEEGVFFIFSFAHNFVCISILKANCYKQEPQLIFKT